ncbi:MAG: hypothetical protein F4Z77_03830 [Dehalococcoidia bacterium]|nr:hypothetical protein [Dehalococcoidia bacterium]MYA53133.1 hypothetical protein [Dehalococcoidia bacterium]
MTRILGFLLPARLYHWLVVRLAGLPLVPARKLHRSVVFRHPLHLRDGHYLLVPTEFAPDVLTLPESTALCLQEDVMEWVEVSGWDYVLIVANFGAFQETPFLHVHLIRIGEPLAEFWDVQPNWLAVELEDDQQPFRAGRRVVRYNALENTAEVHTDIYLN